MKPWILLGVFLAFVCANAHANTVACNNNESGDELIVSGVASNAAPEVTYYIGVSSNPTIGGTTTGAGDYENGATCTLTATPNPGYTFANWTENGNPQTSNPVYSFTVTGSRNIVANFVASSYTISAYADPYIGGTVVGAATYGYQQTCTLTATANPGYTFVCWMENGSNVSSLPTYSFTVTADRNLVATFVQQTFVISTSVNPTDAGSTSGAATYYYNQTCTLTATPEIGYVFRYWSENGIPVSNDATYSFSVTASRNLVAEFAPQSCVISAVTNPTEAGSIVGTGSYDYLETCTLTATPAEGYVFVSWTENGHPVSNEATYEFSVTGNRNLIANFTLANYEISASTNPTIAGSINGAGTYLYGQLCTLVAIANPHYTFKNWSEEDGQVVSYNRTYSFNVTGPRNLVANFAADIYTVTVSANPEVGGVVDGGDDYYYGQECTMTAEANTGYTFRNWTENGLVVTSNSTFVFNVTANRNLVANFTRNQYTVDVTEETGGSVDGDGGYGYGDVCHLEATPDECYEFVGWYEDNVLISNETEYEFVVNENHNITARFQLLQYHLSVAVNDIAMGEAFAEINGTTYSGCDTCSVVVYCGDTCTITAVSIEDYYHFDYWVDENGDVFSTVSEYTFVINHDFNLTAVFSKVLFNVDPQIEPDPNAGEVTGDVGFHAYGDTVTICAEANENYYFEHWIVNDTVIIEDTCYTFVVTGETDIVVVFSFDDAVNESLSSSISLYPNPAYDAVQIEGEDINKVRVYNVFGQLMDMIDVKSQSAIRLEVGHYQSGTYILMLDTDKGTAVKRFVKQ